MDGNRSRGALFEFLDYLGEKGLMAKATAQARKAAASKILGILDDAEAKDVTVLDLEQVVSRFGHLHGKKYTSGSLNTYKSRLSSAVEDFKSYTSNPLAFRPSIQNRERGKAKPSNEGQTNATLPAEVRSETRPSTASLAATNILPIPLRADLTIFIQGLPFDLTEGEARKIAAVVTAMALA